ncbi:MAG: leucine-rich repeat protein [Clostridia bacterium]|nr:leucine-rich repeat protein [Clostridia bacterium]
MNPLKCELCGGKLKMESGGKAVCDSCGMEFTSERLKELVQEIKGSVTVENPVQVDSSHLTENYLDLAKKALKSGNNAEAEKYCNRVLETNPNNWCALLYKGTAAAWQSTFANLRTTECLNNWKMAYSYAPTDGEKESIIAYTRSDCHSLVVGLLKLAGELVDTGFNGFNFNSFIDNVNEVVRFAESYRSFDNAFDIGRALSEGYDKLFPSLVRGANAVTRSFHNVKPTDLSVSRGFYQDTMAGATACEKLATISYLDEMAKANCYKTAKEIATIADNQGVYMWDGYATSYGKGGRDDGGKIKYYQGLYNYQINAYNARMTEAFWNVHQKEKQDAESELQKHKSELNSIANKHDAITRVRVLKERISALNEFLGRIHLEPGILPADVEMLNKRDSFDKDMEAALSYDAYLNKYSILKQKDSVLAQEKKAAETLGKDSEKWLWIVAFFTVFLPGGIHVINNSDGELVKILGFLLCIMGVIGLIGLIVYIVTKAKKASAKATQIRIRPSVTQMSELPAYPGTKGALEKELLFLAKTRIEVFNDPVLRNDATKAYNAVVEAINGKGDANNALALSNRIRANEGFAQRSTTTEDIKKAKAKKRLLLILIVVALLAAVIFAVVLTKVIIPNRQYNKAIGLYNAGKYSEAIGIFQSLNGYKDSTDNIYNAALGLYKEGNYEEAIAAFNTIKDYKESANYVGLKIEKVADGYKVTKYTSSSGQVVIPDGVTIIGKSAFEDCNKLKSITFGNNIVQIERYAFSHCSGLNTVNYNGSLEDWCKLLSESEDNIFGYKYSLYIDGKLLTDVVIPDSIKTINNYTFNNCKSITSVKLPDSVTAIGNHAFSSCESLKSISMTDNIKTIGFQAFSECVSLKSVEIPNGISEIMLGTFYSCRSLESVTIPASVTQIRSEAFRYCNIKTVYYKGTYSQWRNISVDTSLHEDNPFEKADVIYIK